jgi:CheY-like chemotaxis protein
MNSLPSSIAPGTRVLIAEDHVDSAAGLGRLLRLFGCEVVVAANGRDAIQLAPEFAPTAALIDLTLPIVDGFDVARTLRAAAATQHCRLIAMTGWTGDEYAERARMAGFDAHLVKPISVETLIRTLSPAGTPTSSLAVPARRPARANRAEML